MKSDASPLSTLAFDGTLLPKSGAALRAATKLQSSAHHPRCLVLRETSPSLRQGKMARIDGVLTYIPIQGPRIKQLRSGRKTNTGVPGICFLSKCNRPGHRRYDFFQARIGGGSRQFNITTLGREEAWERALRCRAAYERGVIALNAAIRTARHTTSPSSHSSL